MSGLLSGVLPWVLSKGNQARNKLSGLLSDPIGQAEQSLGLLADSARNQNALMAAAFSNPQRPFQVTDKNALTQASMNLLTGPLGFAAAGLTKIPPTQAAKMQAMGMEGGWFRGGDVPTGKRTGPWYTHDAQEATGYAARRGGDVREYAIPSGNYLNAGSSYSSKLAHDVAKVLDDPSFGKRGSQLATELRSFGPDEKITGGQLWQALEARFGNDGAAQAVSRLNAFNGVKGITGGPEVYVFPTAPVRDAARAAFDPAKRGLDDIFAGVMLPTVAAGLLSRRTEQPD
jgi:hypothetical protein